MANKQAPARRGPGYRMSPTGGRSAAERAIDAGLYSPPGRHKNRPKPKHKPKKRPPKRHGRSK